MKLKLTDDRALILLNEFAKIDSKALGLMINLQNAKEFGDIDMLISQIHLYIKEKSSNDKLGRS